MGSRSLDAGLPPAALARHVHGVQRRRELAQALHSAPRARTRRITEQLDVLRMEIARYRAAAIALHARLVELEAAGNDNISQLRRTLIESSVQIEDVVRTLVDSPDPARRPAFDGDWLDVPTIRRR